MTIVLCSKGYPRNYKSDIKINIIKKIKNSKKNFVYHAGTKERNGDLLSNGGRVLNFTSLGKDFAQIRKKLFY